MSDFFSLCFSVLCLGARGIKKSGPIGAGLKYRALLKMATFNIIIVHIPQSQSVFYPHVFCVISVRSGSHESSSVSVKSDQSREEAPNFSEKTPSSAKRYFMDFCFRKYISECLSNS